MQQFIEFGLRHWDLWLAFLVVLGLLLTFELHIRITGASPLSAQQAIFLMNREDATLLDIRDATSFSKEHIAGSKNIPLSELASKINQLDSPRAKPIIINYSQGQSHHRVTGLLKKAGFTKIYHLKGGIMSWKNAALPLAKK